MPRMMADYWGSGSKKKANALKREHPTTWWRNFMQQPIMMQASAGNNEKKCLDQDLEDYRITTILQMIGNKSFLLTNDRPKRSLQMTTD